MHNLQLLDHSAIVNFSLIFRELDNSPILDTHLRTPSNTTTRYGKNKRVLSASKIPVLGAKKARHPGFL